MVFGTLKFQILALYLDFEGVKNIHVLKFLIWGFGVCWRILTGVWHLDLDLVWSLVYCRPMFRILALYLEFYGVKNINVLKVLIWGFLGQIMALP